MIDCDSVRKEFEIYEKIRKDIVWSNNRCYDRWNWFVRKQ